MFKAFLLCFSCKGNALMHVKEVQQLALLFPYKKTSNSANKYLLSPFLFTKHHVKSWGNNSEKKINTGPGLMEQSQVRSFNINSDSLWLNPSYVNTLLVFNWGCGFRMREVRWSSWCWEFEWTPLFRGSCSGILFHFLTFLLLHDYLKQYCCHLWLDRGREKIT